MSSSSLPVIPAIWVLPEATMCSLLPRLWTITAMNSKDSLVGEHPYVVIRTTNAGACHEVKAISPHPKLLSTYHLPRGPWLVRTAAPTPPSTHTQSHQHDPPAPDPPLPPPPLNPRRCIDPPLSRKLGHQKSWARLLRPRQKVPVRSRVHPRHGKCPDRVHIRLVLSQGAKLGPRCLGSLLPASRMGADPKRRHPRQQP